MDTTEESRNPGFDHAIEVLEEQTGVLWRRERITCHALAKTVHPGMEPAAYGILTLLQRDGALRATDLALGIGVGKPSISRQLRSLEELGLVFQQLDPGDARSQRVLLTPFGEQRLAEAQSGRHTAFVELLQGWERTDVDQLGVLIDRLIGTYARDTW